MSDAPIILWFRRDLRLSDHIALSAAVETGRPIIPVFIHDEVVETHGAAPKWRLGLGVEHFAQRLESIGSRLVLRRGDARVVLDGLVQETGATTVWWTRAYDPDSIERDSGVKSALEGQEVEAKSHPGHILFEPWTVETKTGGYYKVYTPYWRAVKDRGQDAALPAPTELRAPDSWPDSDAIADWGMGAAMDRGADVVRLYLTLGEEAAQQRMATFVQHRIGDYDNARDFPGVEGTSGLSENLTYGEISPRACWHAGVRAMEDGKDGAETWLKELVWRDFAYHLVYHTPRLTSGNWRPEWDAFPWNEDERLSEVKAWKRGRTGIRFVDTAMREIYTTGRMHNRARMIVANYLTKNLMCHWKIGQKWFEHCLVDWDPASNALGWQWASGPGPDAAPYFRIFNPVTQLDKFDKDRAYVTAHLAELSDQPPETALAFYDAIPKRWAMSPDDAYPEKPIVGPKEGRERALQAYENRTF
ncbi:Deoxyribodipyrimidine photo-lyase [Rhodobacteraceae bacterium THAF1]|uniref:cryptochrome/photolyase family protein n=1 Tax=Palleronia sp. THAF1 TaxID=2587842 RepID=UPI000F409454|nr:deoxyribodipyrimidine photo-lyase [Palleronia sp. THAF1]QFU09173.1 Deoxyribodipyrimidine photo-lyase [Palleronia sp. THAF1]VDC27254.1 Deoxyribodipyrimidine photo-lyase [Rhodobacteraceae bacterium THAF1]